MTASLKLCLRPDTMLLLKHFNRKEFHLVAAELLLLVLFDCE